MNWQPSRAELIAGVVIGMLVFLAQSVVQLHRSVDALKSSSSEIKKVVDWNLVETRHAIGELERIRGVGRRAIGAIPDGFNGKLNGSSDGSAD